MTKPQSPRVRPFRRRRRSAEILPMPGCPAASCSPAAAQPAPKVHGKPGPAAWNPTAAQRRQVEICAAIGMTLPQVAAVLGKSVKSIQRRCAKEWQHGLTRINAEMAGKLISKCRAGDTASLIFFAKTRLGWSEKQLHEITGRDGGPIVYEKQKADADAFTARIAAMGAKVPKGPAAESLAAPPPHQIN
jgi:transposase